MAWALPGYAADYWGPPYSAYSGVSGKFSTVDAAVNAAAAPFYEDVGKNPPFGTDCVDAVCTVVIRYTDPTAPATKGEVAFVGLSVGGGPPGGVTLHATDNSDSPSKNMGGCNRCTGSSGSAAGEASPHGSAQKSVGANVGGTLVGDPINAANGNAYRQDTDFDASPWLTFRRFYNSGTYVASTALGVQWRHSFDRSLEVLQSSAGSGGINTRVLDRPDGSAESFRQSQGAWIADADTPDTLTEQDDASGQAIGYAAFIAARRQTETYSAAGLLQTITDDTGQGITLTYSNASTPAAVAPSANLLLTVTDPNGRTLTFTYDSSARVSTVTLPDGGLLTYGYDTSNRLVSVQYPEGRTRQYVYNESSLNGNTSQPNLLTGVIDEAGARYESTGYDNQGHAISSSFAGGADATTLTYNYGYNGAGNLVIDSSTLTTPLGTSTTLGKQDDGFGAWHSSGSSAPCGTQCDQPWKAQSYDANGYPASVTDFNGNLTQTTYDANGLLDQQIDASGTASQRTTTTTWAIALRVPLTRTVVDHSGTTLSQMAWVYNATGQPTAQCQMDPTVAAATSYPCATTGTPPAGVRRWTFTYCTAVDTTQCPIVGLPLSVDGPRTDVADVTTYTYYLTDSATAHHGDRQSVTDALGHTTTYASYDGAGRVTRTIDPNGVITDRTYTPRGWLATRTVRALASGAASAGDAVTTIGYTPYGAVASLTDPDGVVTTYGYDGAHRLTAITDAQGNTVQYTLDASGNRTKEQSFTATGAVTRTLSRTFNTLGQLTAVTDGLGHTVFNAGTSGNYDGNGNLVLSKDALGVQRQQGYDALNRAISTIDNASGADAATKNTTTGLAYDALDRLTAVTDPSSLKTSYAYDGLGNGTSLQSPDTGISNTTYDAAGNALTRTDARGVVSTATYDALNRLTGTGYADTTLNVSYRYDEANNVTGCTRSAPVGRLTRVVENTVTTTYCYDSRGNVVQKRQQLGTTLDTTSYAYTLADRLQTSVAPDGTTTTYGRDADGRVASIAVSPPTGAAVTTVARSPTAPSGRSAATPWATARSSRAPTTRTTR